MVGAVSTFANAIGYSYKRVCLVDNPSNCFNSTWIQSFGTDFSPSVSFERARVFPFYMNQFAFQMYTVDRDIRRTTGTHLTFMLLACMW
jgi:hypothetical protein